MQSLNHPLVGPGYVETQNQNHTYIKYPIKKAGVSINCRRYFNSSTAIKHVGSAYSKPRGQSSKAIKRVGVLKSLKYNMESIL